MRNIKQTNIKNFTYYFFNYMINIKDFDSSLLKIDKKSHKNIGIYNIGCITIKKINDYENINSLNSLYLIIGEADGYIQCSSTEENKRNRYLTFGSTDKNKEILTKYIELWDKLKHPIKKINSGECNSI